MKYFLNFFLYYKYYKRKDLKLGSNLSLKNCFLEGSNAIGDNTIFSNSFLGFGSYISMNCIFRNTQIGKYSSIGNNVKVLNYTHPSSGFVSTHPAFFSKTKQAGFTFVDTQKFEETLYLNKKENVSIKIGNDVWIGDDVSIKGGVEISNGIIIGAKALVTKSFEPYSIIAGIPAKVIGKRFQQNEIDFLQKIKWWDKSKNWIKENVNSFSNIDNLKNN